MRVLWILLSAFTLLVSESAFAHRVNVFAWTEGSQVAVESKFVGGTPAKKAIVTVRDKTTGEDILTGKTDDNGTFRFTPPAALKSQGHALEIDINAGEGHRNSWTLEADELPGEAGKPVATNIAAVPAASRTTPSTDSAALTAQDVESIVNRALDAKLAPIHRELALSTDRTPSIADIIGGIGWLIGLAGIAAYFRRRP